VWVGERTITRTLDSRMGLISIAGSAGFAGVSALVSDGQPVAGSGAQRAKSHHLDREDGHDRGLETGGRVGARQVLERICPGVEQTGSHGEDRAGHRGPAWSQSRDLSCDEPRGAKRDHHGKDDLGRGRLRCDVSPGELRALGQDGDDDVSDGQTHDQGDRSIEEEIGLGTGILEWVVKGTGLGGPQP